MPRSVFVDTSAWYALVDRQDVRHPAIAALMARHARSGIRLVPTDYVIDEPCTLAQARFGSTIAFRLRDLLQGTKALDLEWIGPERFDRAEALFRKYHDQSFSFTDCVSFTVMRELGIAAAITMDEHFRIAGFDVAP